MNLTRRSKEGIGMVRCGGNTSPEAKTNGQKLRVDDIVKFCYKLDFICSNLKNGVNPVVTPMMEAGDRPRH